MEVKNFVFCFLFFTNVINLAEEDISENKNISISKVEENNLINKNNWNTRKWGNLYFLFPHVSFGNLIKLFKLSICGEINSNWGIFFNFFLSGIIEYKYIFHKKYGINIRFNLNNLEIYTNPSTNGNNPCFSCFFFESSLE